MKMLYLKNMVKEAVILMIKILNNNTILWIFNMNLFTELIQHLLYLQQILIESMILNIGE